MKTCNDCVYWRREEPLPDDYHDLSVFGIATEKEARCGVTCPSQYTLGSTPACRDFATQDSFVEAVIRA